MTLRLLVVDDEPDLEALMRQKFRRQIREREVELHFARDGEEALSKLREVQDFTVVLTDINMPGMDGLTLLGRIKELGIVVGTIIVSAYGDMGNIRTAMNRGAFDFLLKPIDFTDLETTVRRSADYVKQVRESANTSRQLLALRQELEVASAIQRSILPPGFPPRREYQLFARMEPAREVGGDFYDSFPIGDDKVGFLVADVSGKGVPAALYMAVCRTLFQAVTQTQFSVQKAMESANVMLCSNDMQSMFVTLLFGVLTPTTGELELCSAGHEPPYLVRADGSVERLSLPRNLALAVEPDFAPFIHKRVQLQPGDSLFLYTDGLTEAENTSHELFGRERLEAALRAGHGEPPDRLVQALFAAARAFAGEMPQSDDLTALALRFTGRSDLIADFVSEVPYDLQRMADVLASFEAYCANRGVPSEEFLTVLLCCEEILANAIDHGGSGADAPLPPIQFTARIAEGRITLRFVDAGQEFNPLAHPEPDLESDPDTRPLGGLGIFLTLKKMDQCDYRRADGRNVLTISRPVALKA